MVYGHWTVYEYILYTRIKCVNIQIIYIVNAVFESKTEDAISFLIQMSD